MRFPSQNLNFLTITKIVSVLLLVAIVAADDDWEDNDRNGALVNFYTQECPSARGLVRSTVRDVISNDIGLGAALLRLHFHDCFVRGCDGSILLDSTPNNPAEKDSAANFNSVRGYETIDTIKAAVEATCPGVVSCADIVALAARDAVKELGGPAWEISSGRRDGFISRALESLQNLPPPWAVYNTLVNMFAAKGFSDKEMIVLSGAHTIGTTHCSFIERRLYNSTGLLGVDPTLNADYAASLKIQCPFGSTAKVFFDPKNGGNKFDSNYFSLVLDNKGLFTSDATLLTSSVSRAFVESEAAGRKKPFFDDFAAAMVKMSNLDVLRAPAGEVRRNCRVRNTN